jgi:hypothetical protein
MGAGATHLPWTEHSIGHCVVLSLESAVPVVSVVPVVVVVPVVPVVAVVDVSVVVDEDDEVADDVSVASSGPSSEKQPPPKNRAKRSIDQK